jgi:hypothetical protein
MAAGRGCRPAAGKGLPCYLRGARPSLARARGAAGSGAGSGSEESLSGLGSKGRSWIVVSPMRVGKKWQAQVPGLIAILEGDADARPEAFLRFALPALP